MDESSIQESGNRKRRRVDTATVPSSSFLKDVTIIPNAQTGMIDEELFFEKFGKYQLVYIPQIGEHFDSQDQPHSSPRPIGWKDLHSVFESLEKDQDTWTVETFQKHGDKTKVEKIDEGGSISKRNIANINPGEFLNWKSSAMALQRGYCSFIVQHDRKPMEKLLQYLPLVDLPIHSITKNKNDENNDKEANNHHDSVPSKTSSPRSMKYGPSVWIFFGRNPINDKEGKRIEPEPEPLDGRGEHTDSVSHDATWHYQLSGVKQWHLRPTEELLGSFLEMSASTNNSKQEDNKSCEMCDIDTMVKSWEKEQTEGDDGEKTKLNICCNKGDVLVLNTRLWWHSTLLPAQPMASTDDTVSVPSVSYARDMYFRLKHDGQESDDDDNDNQAENMTNLDGLYAANDIEAGTIVFRESSMPDCELHRTKENPNCDIIELDCGEGAVVSCRDIKAGEFFCILESDSEDDSGVEFEDEEVEFDDT